MILYWIIQLTGGILATALIVYFFGSETGVGASISILTNIEAWKAVFAKPTTWIAIGLSLTFGIIAIGYLTEVSLNPSISLGPTIFSGNLGIY